MSDPHDPRTVDEPGLVVRRRTPVEGRPVLSAEDDVAHTGGGGPVAAVHVVAQDPQVGLVHGGSYGQLYNSFYGGRWPKVLAEKTVNMLTDTRGRPARGAGYAGGIVITNALWPAALSPPPLSPRRARGRLLASGAPSP